ncbi:HD domain-containing protein [uncultured Allofournierella sp.]|uniref:HD domain-containing protein n=1 Tax=uncultured Allofournierella sp. TaxID=1940258 RepID=UPI0037510FA1
MDTLALDLLLTHGRELLSSPLLLQEKQFIQHGSINCYDHSVAVAWVSIQLALRTKAKVDFSSLVRGALLHDYFLYDWHEKDASHRWHGLFHPARAVQNAQRDFGLNAIEMDIIAKHMFPLTLQPPRCKEAVLVTCADKICACAEIFSCCLYRLPETVLAAPGVL